MQDGRNVQVGKISKINKCAGWNNAVQSEILSILLSKNWDCTWNFLKLIYLKNWIMTIESWLTGAIWASFPKWMGAIAPVAPLLTTALYKNDFFREIIRFAACLFGMLRYNILLKVRL